MKKIVVVEDEVALSRALEDKIKREGFEVMTAENGLKGLKIIQKEKPDLVILDILMPVMDGFELLERMKQDSEMASIPAIVLTNLSDGDSMTKIISGGTYDYLVKTDWPLESIIEKIKEKI